MKGGLHTTKSRWFNHLRLFGEASSHFALPKNLMLWVNGLGTGTWDLLLGRYEESIKLKGTTPPYSCIMCTSLEQVASSQGRWDQLTPLTVLKGLLFV